MSISPTLMEDAGQVSDFFENILDNGDGDTALARVLCGRVSGSCPLGYAMEYPPGKIRPAARAGRTDGGEAIPDSSTAERKEA
ncbi:MAG: hypothetical protein QF473_10965 [Planctomycetota bacterium]|jgi:heterodisulfide reductase subunit C|nr:hypothetical protein [Planctomycetota bacterium]MDP6503177.1 hypothetical protein [Planctomycetota bacterium]